MSEVVPGEDGQAQERSRLGQVLETVYANDRWIQDHHVCPGAFLGTIDRRGAGLSTRQPEGLPVEAVTTLRPVGRNATGQVAEPRGHVREAQGETHRFSRIRVQLEQATRDGDRVLSLLTQVPLRQAATLS